MLFLGFYTALTKYMANGPMWNQQYGVDAPLCEKNWWYNLLYINNFLGASKMVSCYTSYYQFNNAIYELVFVKFFVHSQF